MTLGMLMSKQVADLKHRIETLEYLLDLKLPVNVQIGGGTNRAGTSVRTLALRIQAFNEAQEHIKSLDVADVKQQLSEVIK